MHYHWIWWNYEAASGDVNRPGYWCEYHSFLVKLGYINREG